MTAQSFRKNDSSKVSDNHMSFYIFLRTIASLIIPTTIALLLSLVATFIMQANNGASYFYNAWFLFCKVFFPCLPLMMLFILKK